MTAINGETKRLDDVERSVRDRYARGASEFEQGLCCPEAHYDPDSLAHVPEEIAKIDYGCGDPSTHVSQATGDYLLFLHADTLLPPNFADSIRRTLRDETIVAGAFRLKLDAPGFIYRAVECGVALRSRFLNMPYGDQAVFLRRSTFESLGEFPRIPIMEDFEFMRRLKRRGRIAICTQPVITSARRWRSNGPVRTTLRNQIAIIGSLLGVPPATIARFLRGEQVNTSLKSQMNADERRW